MSSCHNSSREACLYFTVNSFARHINALADEAFKPIGLSPSYAHLMLVLLNEPGLSQNQLSSKMNLKASTMTRFVEKLISLNYVKKIQEGRNSFIYPTDEANGLDEKIMQAVKSLYNKYCKLLGEETAKKLTADISSANRKLNNE